MPGLNCFLNHGATTPLSVPMSNQVSGITLNACKELCHTTPGCSGVVTASLASDGLEDRVNCFIRSDIDPALCLAEPRFQLHLAPTLPVELWNALDEYSTLLYGVPGVLDNVSFAVLWPALLPPEVLRHLSPRCTVPSHDDTNAVPFTFWPYNFMVRAGLWVHRPSHEAGGPFADNEWAEITHCAYVLETVTERSPMWFFAAPGSGVRINVGRSFRTPVLREPIRGCDRPFSVCDSSPNHDATLAHYYLVSGRLDDAARMLGINISAYDSIQFPHYEVESWKGAQFTEVVMLNFVAEGDYLYQHLSHPALRCGPPGELRVCRADDPAIVQQAEVCGEPMQGAMQTITQQAGCRDPGIGDSGHHDDDED